MSDHQPAPCSLEPEDEETGAEIACDPSRATAQDLLELDFSRLELARASLDSAFPER